MKKHHIMSCTVEAGEMAAKDAMWESSTVSSIHKGRRKTKEVDRGHTSRGECQQSSKRENTSSQVGRSFGSAQQSVNQQVKVSKG